MWIKIPTIETNSTTLCAAKNPSLEIKYKKKKLERKSESASDVDVVKRVITKEYRSKLRDKVGETR